MLTSRIRARATRLGPRKVPASAWTKQPIRTLTATGRQTASHDDNDDPHQTSDTRLASFGPVLRDAHANIRATYAAPKHPVVLAHGLLGFDELRLLGPALPGVQYWRGITAALRARGIEVITAAVPPSGSIEERGAALCAAIEAKAPGRAVNIIAHSMGGLDSRYMISVLRPSAFRVASLTTISTPHRGTAVADAVFDALGPRTATSLLRLLKRLHIPAAAFPQLTTTHMRDTFNPATPDAPLVRYFSYAAALGPVPPTLSAFALPHALLARAEGPNDGLVGVRSAAWGAFRGTLPGVSHLDLINWTNRLRWWLAGLFGVKQGFNGVAFYLDVCDMLAKEGL